MSRTSSDKFNFRIKTLKLHAPMVQTKLSVTNFSASINGIIVNRK
ncbi:uncharacterized protein METZ01_LOCUS357056, partial [marine metagenome]